MFTRLNGMFAICVIDHRKRTVLIARDHFGVKQMYYMPTGGGIVFASELKGILASGLLDPEIDRSRLVPYLSLLYSPQPHTLIKGVEKLAPGCFLRLNDVDDIEQISYYHLPSRTVEREITTSEATERLVGLLTESVNLQLQADVPVGISLSGGVDSSAIASLASISRATGKDISALTISWPDTVPEEIDCATELCRRLEIPHEILELQMGDFDVDLPLLAWISDEPVADPATYSQFRVAQEASRRVKVLLGGAGGDELFGGYGHYLLPWKKAAYAVLPASWQASVYRVWAHRWIDQASADALSEYRTSRRSWHRRSITNLAAGDEARLRRLFDGSHSPSTNLDRLFDAHRNYDPVNQQMMVDLQSYLPEQLLPMMDRATMAVSIEGRVPFLDVPLVEFCASLSGRTKLGWPQVQKRLLKRAIADHVPSQIVRRKKTGMPSHFPSFMAQHPAVVRHLLLGPESYTRSVLPNDWLEGLLGSAERMQGNFPVLYAMVVLEVWHRLFVEERIYARPTMPLSDLFRLPRKVMTSTP